MNMETETEKLCKDCKYHRCDGFSNLCDYPEFKEKNLVTGENRYVFCSAERCKYGRCKPEGIYWEPKPKVENNYALMAFLISVGFIILFLFGINSAQLL